MKTYYRPAAASLIFTLVAALWLPCAIAKETTPAKDVIVTVNGTEITQAEIDAEIEQKLSGAVGKMPPEQLAQIKTRMQEKALDNFISKKVLAMECDKNKITATPEEIDAALKEMSKDLPEGMTFEDALKTTGLTIDSIKRDISFGLRVNKLIESNVKMPPPPTDSEIKTFYEQNQKSFTVKESVQASHILIKTSKDDDKKVRDEKRARIETLRKQLVKGADFAKTAGENSDCPSKSKGGNLGTFERGRMVKEFDDAAFSQKVGEIGPVIETSFGFHIIRVEAHNPASAKSFDEVKDQIKKHLEQKNKNIAVRDYIEELKSKATIVYTKE